MNSLDNHWAAIRNVEASLISTADPSISPREERVDVIIETPLLIDVQGIEQYTILCTPIDKLAMAAGFLFSEGVIDSLDDVVDIYVCKDDPGTVRVTLTADVPHIMDPTRNLLIVSSCGACGTEDFDKKLKSLPKVKDSFKIESNLLRKVMHEIMRLQPRFEKCPAHSTAQRGVLFRWHQPLSDQSRRMRQHGTKCSEVGGHFPDIRTP